MSSVATRVALLLTLFAIVFANIEIDVTDSVADELNSLNAVEDRYNSLLDIDSIIEPRNDNIESTNV